MSVNDQNDDKYWTDFQILNQTKDHFLLKYSVFFETNGSENGLALIREIFDGADDLLDTELERALGPSNPFIADISN